jgi:hypothetical protein
MSSLLFCCCLKLLPNHHSGSGQCEPWVGDHHKHDKLVVNSSISTSRLMCSNFASPAKARGAVWKNCVAVLRFHLIDSTLFGIAKLLWTSTSGVAIPEFCIAYCDATPLILRVVHNLWPIAAPSSIRNSSTS